ncbi:MAG: polysaccharide deacetylase family protein, partial [Corynebacterium casei]|nr:polysaccharide deacetylase family protein [Corynebacterium casei]
MSKKITIAFGIDVDAVGGWSGSYGGEDSTGDISRGVFAGEVGIPRLVKLMKKYDLPATFFWPGHSIETFPEQFDLTVNEGFEIGVH